MNNKNDQFSIIDSMSRSLCASVYNQNEYLGPIINKMKDVTSVANQLLSLLLILRGKPYCFDSHSYTQEDVDRQKSDLWKKYSRKISKTKFFEATSDFYKCLLFKKDKKGNFKDKTNGNARGYTGFFFSSKDIELDSLSLSCKVLRDCGLFPIDTITNLGPVNEPSYRFGITQDIIETLGSMEAKQIDYDTEKENWKTVLMNKQEELENLNQYDSFLTDIRKIPLYNKFGSENYKRFVNSWRGRAHSSDSVKKMGMWRYFMDRNKNSVFTDEDKYLFGYSKEFMNLIFVDYRDLWEKEDIVGDQDYVGTIIESYHWRKDCVNIPTFGRNNVFNRIRLGINFLNFELIKDGPKFIVRIPHFENKKEKIDLVLSHCPHFDEKTEIKFLEEGEDKGYFIKYSRDCNKKTWYTGMIKQPLIRWSEKNQVLYIDFPVSKHETEGVTFDKNLNEAKWFLLNSSPSESKTKNKHSFKYSNVNMMGVDFGLSNAYVYSVWNVVKKDGGLCMNKELASGFARKCESFNEKMALIKSIEKQIYALSAMIIETKIFISGERKLTGSYSTKKRSISWASTLSVDLKEYGSFLGKYKNMKDKNEAMLALRNPNSNWILLPMLKKLDKDVVQLRTFWRRSKDKEHYNKFDNFTDLCVYSKKSLVKNLIALKRSYSTMGETWDEANRDKIINQRKNFCKNLQDWHKGLARKCNEIAAEIINVARENNVKFIAIEDLDCHPHFGDDSDDNSLKSLMAFGEFKKSLCYQAQKHNKAIIPVDPYLTSQIDYVTGKLGYRPKEDRRHLLVERKGKIESLDCDLNAARNIIHRMVCRHSDLPEFEVKKISDDLYRVMELGKRKSGALFEKIGSKECLFQRSNTGELKVVKAKLDLETKNSPAIKSEDPLIKRINAIYHGNKWFLKHELEAKLSMMITANQKHS